MIFVVNSENRQLFATDLEDMHRQRKAVFVDLAGWKLPVLGDSEVDRYDRDETIYLLAKAQPNGQVLASARLLPTVGPHLMGDLFAGACQHAQPRGPAVWEISRFCVTPELSGRGIRLGLLWEIICGAMETALLYGIEQVIFAANRALLPLALNCGWEAHVLGPGLPDGEDEITAVAVMITTVGLQNVRRRHGVSVPAARLPAGSPPSSTCRPPAQSSQSFSHPGTWLRHLCHG